MVKITLTELLFWRLAIHITLLKKRKKIVQEDGPSVESVQESTLGGSQPLVIFTPGSLMSSSVSHLYE